MLRTAACRANVELARRGLARFTFGNASAIDRELGVVAIKPSGVPYDDLTPESMVVVELGGGKIVDGDLRPSSDLATHLELYRAFGAIGGVVHTHSHYATVWAQAQREIPCFGTTHADYFPRAGARHGTSRQSGDHAGLRGEHRTRDRAPIRASGAGSTAHAGVSRRRATRASVGERRWRGR